MTEIRKRSVQPPPDGFVWASDYRGADGRNIPGIASRLGITYNTYRKWRMRDQGPPTVVLGKKVAARIEWVERYLREQEQAAIAAAEQAAGIAAHDTRAAETRYSRAA